MKSEKIKLYAAGGAALNLAPMLEKDLAEIVYIDTSNANRTEQLPKESLYNIPDLDGAGQDRRRVYGHCAPHIDEIIKKFEPADFNIVLFSASGGSGSVLGPLIVRKLLEKGETVAVVTIGDASSAKFLENTIGTLKSLESIALHMERPVVMSSHLNEAGVPQRVVDEEVIFAITTLCLLTNQNNHGLDTQDVANWINYPTVTPVQPQLSALQIFADRKEAASVLEPVTILSLYNDREKASAFGDPYYSKDGFPREPRADMPEQLHFIINVSSIETFFKQLTDRQVAMNRAFSGYRARKPLFGVDDEQNENGMVF